MAIDPPLETASQLRDSQLCLRHEFAFPEEIRRMICTFLEHDIEALKSLRLASKSWALTAFGYLLRETFVIKSDSDVKRLINVTSEARWSHEAGKTVKAIQIQSVDWLPSFVHRELLERVRGDRSGTLSLFCKEAQAAFSELRKATKERPTPLNQLCLASSLCLAFKQLPRIRTVDFAFPNPFKNALLKKIWNESEVQGYEVLHQVHRWVMHLKIILLAARGANLNLQNITYSQMPSDLFAVPDGYFTDETGELLSGIRSLSLTINNNCDQPPPRPILRPYDQPMSRKLSKFVSSIPNLESLYISFEMAIRVPIYIMPTEMAGKLHTLTLVQISVDPANLLSFLGLHKTTLRRLSLGHVYLSGADAGREDFLQRVKGLFEPSKLEKFQFWGQICGSWPAEFTWKLHSIYDRNWEDMIDEGGAKSNAKTKQLEDFVLRDGPWPMTR